MDYLKLEKLEFSGIRSRIFMNEIEATAKDFKNYVAKMFPADFNFLDLKSDSFVEKHTKFVKETVVFDNRLVYAFDMAFSHNNSNIDSIFKVFYSLGNN